jgi:hypothetical protein
MKINKIKYQVTKNNKAKNVLLGKIKKLFIKYGDICLQGLLSEQSLLNDQEILNLKIKHEDICKAGPADKLRDQEILNLKIKYEDICRVHDDQEILDLTSV